LFFCDFSTTLQICIIFHVNNNDVTHDVSLILAKSTINKQENCRANSLKLLDPSGWSYLGSSSTHWASQLHLIYQSNQGNKLFLECNFAVTVLSVDRRPYSETRLVLFFYFVETVLAYSAHYSIPLSFSTMHHSYSFRTAFTDLNLY